MDAPVEPLAEPQETILRESELDVTFVRPPNLHDGPAERRFSHGLDELKAPP